MKRTFGLAVGFCAILPRIAIAAVPNTAQPITWPQAFAFMITL